MTSEALVHATPSHAQEMYWRELVQLKVDACYIRDYRLSYSKRSTWAAVVRTITSGGGIAGWWIVQHYRLVWASIIAVSQLSELLRKIVPWEKRRIALSRWSRRLDVLFVEAQREWEEIASGRCTDARIRKSLHRLRSQKAAAEARYAPNGLARNEKLFHAAEEEAAAYFRSRYNATID